MEQSKSKLKKLRLRRFFMITTKKWLTLLVGVGFLFGTPLLTQAKSVNEKILDILLESKIVSQEKYQELKTGRRTGRGRGGQTKGQSRGEAELKGPRFHFKRGFSIESLDGENKLRFSGRLQADYRQFLGNNPNTDSFLIRRARLAAIGTFCNYYEFMVESEFGQGWC